MRHLSVVCAGYVAILASVSWAGDAHRGAAVILQQRCLDCHTVRGQGEGHEPARAAVSSGHQARDLGEKLTFDYTPTGLASVLWNHNPAMLEKMTVPPQASEADWSDVFAYLYSLQFFDRAGQAARGRELFGQKHCATCHDSGSGATLAGPPVQQWRGTGDPVMMVYQMWSHAGLMQRENARRRLDWQKLSAEDFLDLSAWVRSVRREAGEPQFVLPDPAEGKALFAANCERCHRGALSLDRRLRGKTWMEIGAGMWNHVVAMQKVPAIAAEEMPKILAYVWELQYPGPPGDPARGASLFHQKRCVECHKDPATNAARSPTPGRAITAYSLVAMSWGSGREMHRQLLAQGRGWPYIAPEDMRHLVAYLQSLPK